MLYYGYKFDAKNQTAKIENNPEVFSKNLGIFGLIVSKNSRKGLFAFQDAVVFFVTA